MVAKLPGAFKIWQPIETSYSCLSFESKDLFRIKQTLKAWLTGFAVMGIGVLRRDLTVSSTTEAEMMAVAYRTTTAVTEMCTTPATSHVVAAVAGRSAGIPDEVGYRLLTSSRPGLHIQRKL
jgi:hypothetical protein